MPNGEKPMPSRLVLSPNWLGLGLGLGSRPIVAELRAERVRHMAVACVAWGGCTRRCMGRDGCSLGAGRERGAGRAVLAGRAGREGGAGSEGGPGWLAWANVDEHLRGPAVGAAGRERDVPPLIAHRDRIICDQARLARLTGTGGDERRRRLQDYGFARGEAGVARGARWMRHGRNRLWLLPSGVGQAWLGAAFAYHEPYRRAASRTSELSITPCR